MATIVVCVGEKRCHSVSDPSITYEHLLSAYPVPGSGPGAGRTAENEIVLSSEEAAQIQAEGAMTRWPGHVLVEQLLNQFS